MKSCVLRLIRNSLARMVSVTTILVLISSVQAEPKVGDFLDHYCIDCHDGATKRGGLSLESIAEAKIDDHLKTWEKVIRRMEAHQMPPPRKDQPSDKEHELMVSELRAYLDGLAAEKPNPGRIDAMRRLTRTEYQNAIRDLLNVKVDVTELLPKDESSHGFDNITVGSLSTTLLNRYISAAQKISRVAVGGLQGSPQIRVVRVAPDLTQEEHVPGLPIGTRGGVLIEHTFPTQGEYEFEIRLTRDRNEEVEGLRGVHEMELLIDREKVGRFKIQKPKNARDHTKVDAHLKTRILVDGGAKKVGVTFVKKATSLLEIKRKPYDAQYNRHRHPRQSPAVYQVSITGPYNPSKGTETASQKQIFGQRPAAGKDATVYAEEILSRLMRLAYRRPVTADELAGPMRFYHEGRKLGDFEAGIEMALSSILVSPRFLFRIEDDPAEVKASEVYRLDDLKLASRLSFFLWSSLPDDELLKVAEKGRLSDPKVLEQQVRRMLLDPRSEALVTNFANQWLQLRNLDALSPDLRLFPDFDDNLRQSFKRETELFFQSIMNEDRSVIDLLQADYTFLNERLARHYGIPHLYGSRFRRVDLGRESQRGGLLRHGSILTVTSYATRTSPVIRGNWILENILGTPAPPPPADVPSLDDDGVVLDRLPMREKLAAHREKRSCAVCHNLMDPVGFSLEQYDAVGRWRTKEGDRPVDASGGLPDGQSFAGVTGLEQALLKRPELFARTITEKLLTYAVGRGVEYYDAPAIRRIVDDAAASNYRFSDLILGVVKSVPFTMRKKP